MSLLSSILVVIITVFILSDAEVIHRTEDNEMGLKAPIVIAYYKFDSKTTTKMRSYWRNRMQTLSEEHKDLVFAVSDSVEFENRLYDYGFQFDWKQKLDSEPIVVAEDKNGTRFLLDSKLTTDSLQSFVQRFKNKELIPHIKSQPIPDNTGVAVKEVVGKTFEDMVINNPKDVFILMYAHWCGHCKEALPIWQRLGERLASEPNVDILQIDITKNEVHKPFKTMNYPTIYWIPSGDKYSPKKFLGKRTVSKFIEYVAQKATKPLLKFDRKGQPLKESIAETHKTEL